MKELLKSKTVWTSIATIIVACAGAYTGQIAPDTAFQTIAGALTAVFLRDGVRKAGSK
jgi:hypothetical protein